MTWLLHYIHVYICVYMLDGERSFANSESPQNFIYTNRALYGTRAWRYRAAHAPLATLKKEKEKPSKRAFQIIFNNY